MKIFIATKNKKKLVELERILTPLGFEVLSEKDLDSPLEEIEETGTTFRENALLKAHSGFKETGLITVADDSGLSVDILDGAPGLYSARYSGTGATYASNNEKLLAALKTDEAVFRLEGNSPFAMLIPCPEKPIHFMLALD